MVLVAFAELEESISRHSLFRRPSEGAEVFLDRTLPRASPVQQAKQVLVHLYDQARYSEHPLDGGHAAQAQAASQELQQSLPDLGAPTPGLPEPPPTQR